MALKVLFAASECSPLVKVGGLADVVGSLPKELVKLGVEVALTIPAYKGLSGTKKLPGTDVPIFLIENEEYFGVSEEPYRDSDEDPQRFGYFCRKVIEGLADRSAKGGFKPDVIHAHDWHASLVPVMVKKRGLKHATVITVHNLAMQGISAGEAFFPAGLSEHDLKSLEWDFQDRNVDFLLQGVIHADVINTVSPTYAKEILSPEFGEGLHEILKAREARLFGVLNGIDYEVFDPSRDEDIYEKFDVENFKEGKAANKKELQKELGFKVDEGAMLVGFIGRLADQKGLSLVVEGFEKILKLPIQFVLLGTGDPRYERQFKSLAGAKSSKFSAQIKFDKVLAQRMYAGCDLILVPSRFEPCGLVQMIAMRYGALPLVRATGGLADSVTDGEDGFAFDNYEAAHLVSCLQRAVKTFGTPMWERMVEAAVAKDFSWAKSAKKYVELYEKAIEYAKGV